MSELKYIYTAERQAGREEQFFGYFSTRDGAKDVLEQYHEQFRKRASYPAPALEWQEDDEGTGLYAIWPSTGIEYFVISHPLDVSEYDIDEDDDEDE